MAERKNMTPTDLRQNLLPVKRVGLHYTYFRNHLPLFMRLPGSQNPKNRQNLHRVAKVGLVERRGAALEKQKQTEIIRRYFSETKPRLSQFRMCPTKRGLSRSSMFRFSREFALNEGKGLLLESTLLGRQNEV